MDDSLRKRRDHVPTVDITFTLPAIRREVVGVQRTVMGRRGNRRTLRRGVLRFPLWL